MVEGKAVNLKSAARLARIRNGETFNCQSPKRGFFKGSAKVRVDYDWTDKGKVIETKRVVIVMADRTEVSVEELVSMIQVVNVF